jgi:D-proline reductase (dithiol) PrdB
MGHINEFSRSLRLFLRTYRWRRISPVPWTPLAKPLSDCRVGIVTSAGLVEPGQEPFDDHVRGGDWSFRTLAADADVQSLIESHRSQAFDRAGLQQDKGLAFPVERLRELAEVGRIGSVSHRHLSCMGSITAPGRLIKQSAPEAAKIFVEDEVDVALLVPV